MYDLEALTKMMHVLNLHQRVASNVRQGIQSETSYPHNHLISDFNAKRMPYFLDTVWHTPGPIHHVHHEKACLFYSIPCHSPFRRSRRDRHDLENQLLLEILMSGFTVPCCAWRAFGNNFHGFHALIPWTNLQRGKTRGFAWTPTCMDAYLALNMEKVSKIKSYVTTAIRCMWYIFESRPFYTSSNLPIVVHKWMLQFE